MKKKSGKSGIVGETVVAENHKVKKREEEKSGQ